jgi:carbon monoxide dehydrogenase subunit G
MASIIRQLHVNAPAEVAWDALRDYGNVHRRVARGFVADTRTDGQDRIVTFVNGAVARERLVAADDEHRRLVYSVVESSFGLTHHQASVEVIPSGGGSTLRWITDVLPDAAAEPIGSMMDAGAVAIRATLAE